MNTSDTLKARSAFDGTQHRQTGPQSSGRTYTTYEHRHDGAAHVPADAHPNSEASNTGITGQVMALRHLVGAVALAALVGCGSMPGERAVSGAGIGAGAGAAIGAVTGMGVGTGAAIGAATGAAAGGLTKKKQIDLGEPVWKR